MEQLDEAISSVTLKKHKGLKLLSALSMALPMFLGSAQKAFADSTDPVVNSTPQTVRVTPGANLNGMVGKLTIPGGWDNGVMQEIHDGSGNLMYCLEPLKSTPNGNTSYKGEANAQVRAVLRASEAAGFNNSQEGIAATQLAVWTASGAVKGINWTNQNVHNMYNQLMGWANDPKWQSDNATTLQLTKVGNTTESNGVAKQDFKIDGNNIRGPVTIQPGAGVTVTDNGKPLTNNQAKGGDTIEASAKTNGLSTNTIKATTDGYVTMGAEYNGIGGTQSTVELMTVKKQPVFATGTFNIPQFSSQTATPVKSSIQTTATNNETSGKLIQPTNREDVKDTVAYTGLVPNRQYTMQGVLMDKNTNKPVTVNGKEVTATQQFTPKSANGTVDLHFIFDATQLKSHNLVAFESVQYQNQTVADHKDINSSSQTVGVTSPTLHTTLSNNAQKTVTPSSNNTVQDVVKYTDLLPNVKYTLQGKLMDKSTNQPVANATTTFTPKGADGETTVTFHFDGSKVAGHSLVAFEDLYDNNRLVAQHEDMNDTAQTITVAKPSSPVTPSTPIKPTSSTTTTPTVAPVSVPQPSQSSVLPQTNNSHNNLWIQALAVVSMLVTVGSAVEYARRHQASM